NRDALGALLLGSDNNVFRLEIAMDHARAMRCCDGVAQLIEPVGRAVGTDRAATFQYGPPASPTQQRHDEIRAASAQQPVIEDRNDVGVIQLCGSPRLSFKAPDRGLVS